MRRPVGHAWVERPRWAERVVLTGGGIVLVTVEGDGARSTLTMAHGGRLHSEESVPGFTRARSVAEAARFAGEVTRAKRRG